jgi:internalin A
LSKVNPNVQAAINRVRNDKLTRLDLAGSRLRELPEEIFGLTQLETLCLQANHISAVPHRIRELPNLKRIDLEDNPITDVPDVPGLVLDWEAYIRCRLALSPENISGIAVNLGEKEGRVRHLLAPSLLLPELSKLTSLRYLSIATDSISLDDPLRLDNPPTQVRALIKSIGQFVILEELRIFGLSLGAVPPEVRQLRRLRFLNLSVGIQELPSWISELTHLTVLRLPCNELETLPDSLAELHSLQEVSLTYNRMSEIPPVIFRIPSLTVVDLSSNSLNSRSLIKRIPTGIIDLPRLSRFDVEGQPIESPPPEIVKEGVGAIKNYWRQQREAGIDYLCEAKLLIVGEAGAGKTTLANKIVDPSYQLKTNEESTEGIEVTRWGFRSAIRVKTDADDKLLERDFRVNIWDFGGQEVYHATHQFFLTRRSLYALVADDRKEDTDFNYWLQVVELLSDRSPLLIVQNEKQERQRDVNLGNLRARFPNLREAYPINLATNRGLSCLVDAIRQELERLPHIGTPLPSTWKRVREGLEQDERDFIGLEEYLRICRVHGFQRLEDELQLSGYLHDLGICLHFQDDPVLKNTIVLKPKWGTDAVYRVLDDRVVIANRGRFVRSDLTRIWSEQGYAQMRDELLRLMMKFQLCYQLPEGDMYIAPQLLSPTQPSYHWDEKDNLIFRYEYDFMPKGLVTRLIVALNHLIADQNLVWKSGVIFERDGTRAEAIEDYPRRKITLRIAGSDTRGLLAIIDDQMDRIHRSYPRLQYEKYLPCNCEACRKRNEPFTYSLQDLRDFAKDGACIQCRISRKLVDAGSLIQHVFPTGRHLSERLSQVALPYENNCQVQDALKEVFVSYAWGGESESVVDQIEETLKASGVVLVRDKNDVKFRDSIQTFMRRMGRGKCVVVILSRQYLESKNCMFELNEIAARGDIRDRVFPIVLEGTDVYDAVGRLRYIRLWERKISKLNSAIKTVAADNLTGIREEIDLFVKIRTTIASIVDILGDMNALTVEKHRGSNFQELAQAIQIRLAE